MEKPPVATIINFCTIEARFIQACIDECRHFSRQIIIPVCDHFFNGEEENRELLQGIYSAFPDCQFVEYPFSVKKIPPRILRQISLDHFWHCVSRLIGMQFVNDQIEMVLFLDADEVPDGKKFSEWLKASDYSEHSVLKLANYWYFREPRFQSTHWEDSVVFAHRHMLTPAILVQERERDAIYDLLPSPKRRSVTGVDGLPMFHHFSWVRTKEEMLRKVQSWGHRSDRDWTALVEKEFSMPFSFQDFVHGYSYRGCPSSFKISMDPVSFPASCQEASRLKKLDERQLVRILNLSDSGWVRRVWNQLFGEEGE